MRTSHGWLGNPSAWLVGNLIEEEKDKEFEKTGFEGIEKRMLDIGFIPSEIKEEITRRNGEIYEFFILRANCPIPHHTHYEIGEVYIGGEGFDTIINHRNGGRSNYSMALNLFTIVDCGDAHGVDFRGGRIPAIFLAVKYGIFCECSEETSAVFGGEYPSILD